MPPKEGHRGRRSEAGPGQPVGFGGLGTLSADPTTGNGRVAESRGHWRQWLRWYVSGVFAAVVVHVQVPIGSAVCKALLTKGIKVTSVR